MTGFIAGKLFVDTLALCLVLYLVARFDADDRFKKVGMVVVGTVLFSFVMSIAFRHYVLSATVVWLEPLIEVVVSAFVIVTFCWVSLGKATLIVGIFLGLHLGFGFAMDVLSGRVSIGASASDTLVQEQTKDVQAIKNGAERAGNIGTGTVVVSPSDNATTATTTAHTTVNPAPAPVSNVTAVLPPAKTPPAGVSSVSPPTNAADNVEADWKAAKALIKISGISGSAGSYTALMGRRMITAGDIVSVQYKGRTYRWTVSELTRDNIQYAPVDVR